MASTRRTRPVQRKPPPASPRPGAARPAARPGSQGGRYPAASPGRKTWTTPGAGPLRIQVETASRKPLVYLHAAPRWALFLAFLGLAVGAALAPHWWGSLCAIVLAIFLGWLLFLAWPQLKAGPRTIRLAVVGLLVGVAVARPFMG